MKLKRYDFVYFYIDPGVRNCCFAREQLTTENIEYDTEQGMESVDKWPAS